MSHLKFPYRTKRWVMFKGQSVKTRLHHAKKTLRHEKTPGADAQGFEIYNFRQYVTR